MGTAKFEKEIDHILLLRWKEEASQGAIDNAMAELRALKDKIPGIALPLFALIHSRRLARPATFVPF